MKERTNSSPRAISAQRTVSFFFQRLDIQDGAQGEKEKKENNGNAQGGQDNTEPFAHESTATAGQLKLPGRVQITL